MNWLKTILKSVIATIAGKVSYLVKGRIEKRLPTSPTSVDNAALKAFVKKHSGQRVRGGSCVQLFRRYIEEVLKLPPLEGLGEDGGAEGLFLRYNADVGPLSRQHLERISFYGDNHPQPGDILIYQSTDTNRWGHVGIYIEPSVVAGTHVIFDQHGFGSQAGRGAQLRERGVGDLLGWLRKRSKG